MLNKFFLEKIKENFEHEFTEEQNDTIVKIVDFLYLQNQESLFLLRGYAGTGKSSMLGALVKTMTDYKQKAILLAPTGRAAKVFSNYANHPAFTIHKRIYRLNQFGGGASGFSLMDNLFKDTLFIVDEASMISNSGLSNSSFGSGRLLDDLISYVYSGENCRLILIGDIAQLPPVMEEESPALQKDILEAYGMVVFDSTLSQIVRQAESSGILFNATNIRNILRLGKTEAFPKIKLDKFSDIRRIMGDELIEEISTAYRRDGLENTMVVTRSNKRANLYNQGIRNQVLFRDFELSSGDLLMISKNNYFWTKEIEGFEFLANGEILEVRRVRNEQELYGFRFCDVLLRSFDHDIEFEAKILLETLHSETANLARERHEELFNRVLEDYQHVKNRADKMRQIKIDPFFNALHVKFAYAVTCHKAQGGEWMNVFLDLGYIAEEHLGINFYRWLYTAITRASHRLYMVNISDDFL